MKKFEMLGKLLSKDEQRNIKGGVGDDLLCIEVSGCTSDSQCAAQNCICGHYANEQHDHCIKELA